MIDVLQETKKAMRIYSGSTLFLLHMIYGCIAYNDEKNKQCAVAITTLYLFLLYYPAVHCLENVDMTGLLRTVLSHKISMFSRLFLF